MSSLDKVLRVAQPLAAPDSSELVRLASDDLERIAMLLAQQAEDDEDDDGEGDDEDEDEDDKTPPWMKKKGSKGKAKKKSAVKEKVAASRSLVLEAMVALSQLAGGETLSLSVLTQAEREKPGAHTIPGSTDFPIPDVAHLSAAVGRYKQGKLAGHPASTVKAHILKHAKRLGRQVELAEPNMVSEVIVLARQQMEVAMEHAPMSGEHEHPHMVRNVHSHKHTHNGDSRHACGEPVYSGAVY